MPQYKATEVRTFLRSEISSDGRHMVLIAQLADGSEFVLAIPHGQLLPLVECAAGSASALDKIGKKPAEERDLLPLTWWEIGKLDGTEDLALSLTLKSGGTLSFRLHGSMPKGILETLQTICGTESPLPAPTGQKH